MFSSFLALGMAPCKKWPTWPPKSFFVSLLVSVGVHVFWSFLPAWWCLQKKMYVFWTISDFSHRRIIITSSCESGRSNRNLKKCCGKKKLKETKLKRKKNSKQVHSVLTFVVVRAWRECTCLGNKKICTLTATVFGNSRLKSMKHSYICIQKSGNSKAYCITTHFHKRLQSNCDFSWIVNTNFSKLGPAIDQNMYEKAFSED